MQNNPDDITDRLDIPSGSAFVDYAILVYTYVSRQSVD